VPLMQQGVVGGTRPPATIDSDHPFGTLADDVPGGRCARHLRALPDLPLDFDAVVRSLAPRLQRYATRRLGDRHEAEELVQEALLRAYEHRAALHTEDDVAAWTTCVTGRLVIDRLRVRGRSTPVGDIPEGSRTARDTADVVVARDEARLALDALDAMPARQAAVLWAREVEGLGYDEIGTRFGMTEPAVRSLLSRARKALRKEYAVRGGTFPGAGLAFLAPWASGTGWLERLRTGLDRLTAPAALGVVGAGLVTATVVVPLAPTQPPSPAPAVVHSAAPDAAPSTVTVAAAPPAPAPAPAPVPAGDGEPVPAASATASTSTPPETGALGATGVNDTCVSAAGAGAGGAGCAPVDDAPVLQVAPPAELTPDAVDMPGVSTNKIDCTALPAVPLTRCTPTSGDS
jgi:RNA polymerase sigma factor (sigma-70 family)